MEPGTGKVHMDYAADLSNIRLPGSTWFHEHGHVIDRALGYISNNDAFLKAIKADVKAYEQKIKDEKGLSKINDARFALGYKLTKEGYHTHAIQDIYGGAIKKPYPMVNFAHGSQYWKDHGQYGVCLEAFAHMCEASTNAEKQGYMQEYLPTAWKWFTDLIETEAKKGGPK